MCENLPDDDAGHRAVQDHDGAALGGDDKQGHYAAPEKRRAMTARQFTGRVAGRRINSPRPRAPAEAG